MREVAAIMRRRYLLIVTQDGYAKRTPIEEFKPRHKGTKGASALRDEQLLGGAAIVGDDGEILILTQQGKVLRTSVNEVAILSRAGKGGRIIQLKNEDRVVAILAL